VAGKVAEAGDGMVRFGFRLLAGAASVSHFQRLEQASVHDRLARMMACPHGLKNG
jgi:hypothetical protein